MDKFTRHAKKSAHEEFDKLWKNKYMSRSDAYKWLAKKLNIPLYKCHISKLNESQCFDVERIVMKELKRRKHNVKHNS